LQERDAYAFGHVGLPEQLAAVAYGIRLAAAGGEEQSRSPSCLALPYARDIPSPGLLTLLLCLYEVESRGRSLRAIGLIRGRGRRLSITFWVGLAKGSEYEYEYELVKF